MSTTSGRQGGGVSTAQNVNAPANFVKELSQKRALPITISGANQITFTLNASQTAPAHVQIGNEITELRTSVSYTWVTGSNDILAADGSASTNTGAYAAAAVVYFYAGIDSTDTVVLLPSLAAPSFVEGPFESGSMNHPGTARAQEWAYVGFQVLATTTGAGVYTAMDKSGWWYEFPVETVATTTTWAALDFSAVLPAHGVECAGYLETSATSGDTIEVGTSSTDGRGVYLAKTPAAVLMMVPFGPLTVNSSGQFYGSSTTAAGDVHVTRIKDVV